MLPCVNIVNVDKYKIYAVLYSKLILLVPFNLLFPDLRFIKYMTSHLVVSFDWHKR